MDCERRSPSLNSCSLSLSLSLTSIKVFFTCTMMASFNSGSSRMGLTGLPALCADTWGAKGISASLASDVPRLKAALAPSTPSQVVCRLNDDCGFSKSKLGLTAFNVSGCCGLGFFTSPTNAGAAGVFSAFVSGLGTVAAVAVVAAVAGPVPAALCIIRRRAAWSCRDCFN